MRPDFGAGLELLLHEPNSLATRRRIRDLVQSSLARWEQRILLDRVEVVGGRRRADAMSASRSPIACARTGEPGALAATLQLELRSADRDAVPAARPRRSQLRRPRRGHAARAFPAHTPEWTNPRLGDPGRTLIELFAWLGDALLYRANLVPERQRLVFLKLLGTAAASRRRRRAPLVSLAVRPGRHARRRDADAAAGRSAEPCRSRRSSEITVLPSAAEAYVKRALSRRRERAASAT